VDEVFSQGLHEFLDELQTGLNEAGEGIFGTFFALDTPSRQPSQAQA
jgi:hypothetical protein